MNNILKKIESRRNSRNLFFRVLIIIKDFNFILINYIKKPRRLYEDIILNFFLLFLKSKSNSDVIPGNYFYYWTGHNFQFVHYLSVLSLIKSTPYKKITVYFENEPNSKYWNDLKKLKIVFKKIDWENLLLEFSDLNFDLFLNKSKPNHKSDLFRYLVLYNYGGIYLDFDTLVIKDLTFFRKNNFFASYESPKKMFHSIVNGAILGSSKKNPILKTLINYVKWSLIFRKSLDWVDIGPGALTKIVKHKNKVKIYPYNYFYPIPPKDWKDLFSNITVKEPCYVIHFWGSKSNKYTAKINKKYILNKNNFYTEHAKMFVS